MQHVGFTAAVDNASATVKSHASTVNATLTDAIAAIDRGIAAAQKIRAAGVGGRCGLGGSRSSVDHR